MKPEQLKSNRTEELEAQQKLFDTFFTTKPSGEGTGLGMSIVREIIEQKHHGKVSFESEPDRFTRFVLTIPVQS